MCLFATQQAITLYGEQLIDSSLLGHRPGDAEAELVVAVVGGNYPPVGAVAAVGGNYPPVGAVEFQLRCCCQWLDRRPTPSRHGQLGAIV